MIYTLDLERNASSALVRSKSSSLTESVLPSFWADKIKLELDFVEPASWVGDAGAVVKARIGLLPNTYLVDSTTAVWDGKKYTIDLDFNNSSFNSAITDKLELTGFFEIQLEYNGRSRTLLQQTAKFRNSFLSAGLVSLTLPDEPSLPEAEVKSPPNAPSFPEVDRSPLKPSLVELNVVATLPEKVRSANLSIKPLKPSLPDAEELLFPPSRINEVRAKIYGTPDAPNTPSSFLVLPTPLSPEDIGASLVVAPQLEAVTAFEVVSHNLHKDHHKYLYLQTSGNLTNRLTGSIMQAENKPFIFSGLDSRGAPTYLRESPVELIDPETGIATDYEHIKLERRASGYMAGLNPFPTFYTPQDALLYNPAGYNTISISIGGVTSTEYTPKNLPSNWQSLDPYLYEIKVLLAYQYNSDTSSQPRPNSLEVTAYTQELFPDPNQLNKLGYKHYGGRKISYLTTKAVSIKNASDNTRAEFADAGHTLTFQPAYSGLVALPPAIPTMPEAEEILPINNAPSLVTALVRDFDILRYSPALWLDASQEGKASGQELDKLSNFAGTSYEVFNHAQQAIMQESFFDFSSTRNSYKIPQNVFGTHFEQGGNEVEIYLAFKPLDYDEEADTLNTNNRAYNPHLFVNLGSDQRFTAHAPHTNGETFYLDAGRVAPVLTSRTFGSKQGTLNKNTIVGFRSSVGSGLNTIFVNGFSIAEKTNIAEKVFMSSLLLGGWGATAYGQSMHLYEVLCFRNKLEDTQRQKVEGYLAHKWGVDSLLASNHPFKSNRPDNYGEFRALDPFPKKPFVVAEMYPVAPSSPLSGFGSAKPSDFKAVAFPNTPSLVVADDIPPLRFLVDGTTEISAINNQGITSDLPAIEEELKNTIERIEVYNTNSQLEAVTFTITNNSTGEISPAISSVEDGIIESFALNAVESKPYLASGEKGELSFSIKAEDNHGEYNILPVKINVTGISRITTALATLENIPEGEVYLTSTEPDQIESIENNEVDLGYPEVSSLTPKYIKIPHKKQEFYIFDIRVLTPDKSGADLVLAVTNKFYKGRYYQQGGSHRFLAESKFTLTAGNEIYPDVQVYNQTLEMYLTSNYRYANRHKSWDLYTDGKLPIKIRCTNVTEIVPDVEKVYSIEVEFLVDSTISNANGLTQDNLLYRLLYRKYFGEPDYSTPAGRRSFWGYLPEEIAEDFKRGFNFRFLTAGNQELIKLYPVSYLITAPRSVKSSVGNRVWAKPSLPEADTKLAKFPVDLNTTPVVSPYPLTGSPRFGLAGSWDNFHFVDPDNKLIGWSSSNIVRPADPYFTQAGNGTTWVWSANFKNFQQPRPTFIHYTELNNIRVDEYPEPVIQKPWRYPFDWYLVDTAGNKTTGQGVLDPITQQKLLIRDEKIITFPSGKKIVTEFGGYVCTSGKARIRIHPAGFTNSIYTHNLNNYTEFTCEINDLGSQIKQKFYRYFSDESRKLIDLPDFTFPVKVTKTHTGQALPVPATKYLSNRILRMLTGGSTAFEYSKNNPRLTDVTKEYSSYTEASYLFHHETQRNNEYTGNYEPLGFTMPPLYGDNQTALLNYSVFTLSLHIEPSDFITPSVHPKWGRKYEIYSDNKVNGRGATNVIAEVPKLPSHTLLETASPNKIINYPEWEYIQANKPKAPTKLERHLQITYKDLVPDRDRNHIDFYTSYSASRGAYFIVPYDYKEDFKAFFWSPMESYWKKEQVRAGDIYYTEYKYGTGMIICRKAPRFDGKNTDGAGRLSLHPNNETSPLFSTIFKKRTESTPVVNNNFYLKNNLLDDRIYRNPSFDTETDFSKLKLKYLKVKSNRYNDIGVFAGDIVRVTDVIFERVRGLHNQALYFATRTEEELNYLLEQGYRNNAGVVGVNIDFDLKVQFEREEEGQRPDNYTPPVLFRRYFYDYTEFFEVFEPFEYARTYVPPAEPKEFLYLGEPAITAKATLGSEYYRPSNQLLGADRVSPESLQELLLDTSLLANKEQELFLKLSDAVGNYPAGQYFRIIGNGRISVPSGQSPYLLDSEGNIIMEEYTSDAGTQRLTRPVPNPDYIATYNIDTALVVPTGSTSRPAELQLYYYNQQTFLYDREQLENFDITGKVNSYLFEIIEPAVNDMVLNRYFSGVNTNPNGYFIRSGEDAIHTSETANADLAEQNKFIIAKQDYENFKAGRIYKMQSFRSEQSQLGADIFDHYGEFYEMEGDNITGDKFTIEVTDSDLLRVFYPITYAKVSS